MSDHVNLVLKPFAAATFGTLWAPMDVALLTLPLWFAHGRAITVLVDELN